jgi:phosphomannomutase
MDALPTPLTCFKAYDIRGRLGEELNTDIAYRVGRAFAEVMKARRVVIGRDVRPSSEELSQALARGLVDAGARFWTSGCRARRRPISPPPIWGPMAASASPPPTTRWITTG